MAITRARIVIAVEMVPAIARLPVEKNAPISGVIRVTPQVGQPAPRAIRPVMMPALLRFSEFLDALLSARFLFQRRTMIPIKIPCNMESANTGSQSRKGWLMPKMARKLLPRILRLFSRPVEAMSSNFAVPPARRFINIPKKKKLGMKPYQKRFSLVASRIPLPAKTNSSNHFCQFISIIIA